MELIGVGYSGAGLTRAGVFQAKGRPCYHPIASIVGSNGRESDIVTVW